MPWNKTPWSRTKKLFEQRMASPIQGRVKVHLTEYSKSAFDVGRGWITCDGEEVVSVSIPSFYSDSFQFDTEDLNFGSAVYSCNNLPFDQIACSQDPFISGLKFLDKRFGGRRLREVKDEELNPFSRELYQLRVRLNQAKCEQDGAHQPATRSESKSE